MCELININYLHTRKKKNHNIDLLSYICLHSSLLLEIGDLLRTEGDPC